MHKVWAVIRREFLERVRTRAFIVATLLGPLFFGGMVILPALLMNRAGAPKRIVVVDAAQGDVGARAVAALSAARRGTGLEARVKYVPSRITAPDRAEEVRDSLVPHTGLSKGSAPGGRERGGEGGGIDGILIVSETGLALGKLTYLGANVGSLKDMEELREVLSPVVISERLRRAGVDPQIAFGAITAVSLETRKVSEGKLTNESGAATFALAYAMSIILYMALLLYGNQVMGSVIEEKSNRIIEVLVSSLTPFQMLLGKVLGVGLVSLLQIGIWSGTATLLSTYRGQIMRAFGAGAGAAPFALPSMKPDLLAVFLLFFILGFLLYCAAYAAVGAMCNTVQETQQAAMPVTISIILGLMCMFALLNEPNGSLAKGLSMVPFLAPFVVPVRYSIAPVPLPQLLASVGMTVLGLLAIVWVAARIYRVGILMYGKRASVKDVLRWVRAA